MKRVRQLCPCIITMSDSNESSDYDGYYTAEEECSSGDDSSSWKTATLKVPYDQINGEEENKASIDAGASASLIRQSSNFSGIEVLCRKVERAQLGQRGIQTIDCPNTECRPRKGNVSQSCFRLSCACCRSQVNDDPNKKEANSSSKVSGNVNLSGSPMTPAEVLSRTRACIPCSYETSAPTSAGSTVAINITGDTSWKESCSSTPNISWKCSGDSKYKNVVNKVPKDKDSSQPGTQLRQESVSYSQAERNSLEGRTQMDERKWEMVHSSGPGTLTAYPLEPNTQREVPGSHIRDLPTPVGYVAAAGVPVRSFAEVVMSPTAPPALQRPGHLFTPLQHPRQKRSPPPQRGKTPKKKAKSEKSTTAKCRIQANIAVKKHIENSSDGTAIKGEVADQPARSPADANRAGGSGGGTASKGEIARQAARRPIDTSQTGGSAGGTVSKGEIASQAANRPADSSLVGGSSGGAGSKGETARQAARRPIDTSQTGGNGGGAVSKEEIMCQAVKRPIDTSQRGGNGGGAVSKGDIASQVVRRPIDTSETGGSGGGAVSKGDIIASQVARRPADNMLNALPDELCSAPHTSEEEATESVRQDIVKPVIILVKGMHNNVSSLFEIVKNTPYAFVPGKGLSSQYHRIANTLSAVIQWMSQFCDALDKAKHKRPAEKGVGVSPPVAVGNLREISARVDQLCAVLSEAYKQGRMAQNGSKIKHHMAKEKQKTTVRVRVIMDKLNDLMRRLDEWIAVLESSSFEIQPLTSAAAFPLSLSTPPLKPLPTPAKDTSEKNLPSDRPEILNAQSTVKTDNEMPKHLRTNTLPHSPRSALGPQAPPKMPSVVSHSCSPYGHSSYFDSLQTCRSNCNQTGVNGESGEIKVHTEMGGANALPIPTIPYRPPARPIHQAWAGCTKVQQGTSHLQVPVEYQTNLIGHSSRGFAGNTNEVIGNVEQTSNRTYLAPPRNPNIALHTFPQPVARLTEVPCHKRVMDYSHVTPLGTSMPPAPSSDSVQPFGTPAPQPGLGTNATRPSPVRQAIPVRSPAELICDGRTATKDLSQPSTLMTVNPDTHSSLARNTQHHHVSPVESATPLKKGPRKAAEQAPAEVPIPTEGIRQTGANSLIPDVISPVITGPDGVDLASYHISPVGSVSEVRRSIDCQQFGGTVEENTQFSPGMSMKNTKRLLVAQKDKFIKMCLSGMKNMKGKDDSPRPSDGSDLIKVENLSSIKEACLNKNVSCVPNGSIRDEIYQRMPSPNPGVNGNDRCNTPAQYHAFSSQSFERSWKCQSVPSAPNSVALPEVSKYQSSISTVTTIPVRTSVERAIGFLSKYPHPESAKTQATTESTQQPQFSRNIEVVQQVGSSSSMQSTGIKDAKKKDEKVNETARLVSKCDVVGKVNNGETGKSSEKGCANTAEVKQSGNVLCDGSSTDNSPAKVVESHHVCKSGPVPRTRPPLKAKRRLKYIDAAEQPRNEASVATMEERGAHQENCVNDEALTTKATSPGTKLPVNDAKVRSNHEKGNVESVDVVRSTGKTYLPCIEESPEIVNDEELQRELQMVTNTTTTQAENGTHLKNGDSQPSSTAKSPATPANGRQSASPITPNTPELNPGLPKTRSGTHGTPNRRRRGKYNYDTVNYRKSINCCCEEVCDYCVP